ncbi:hypothetical protein C8R47DRAFT_1142465 [Mycena vitilis]|nr:hypothetical protein C8R47DRAFT_1142465 [Mycena vitilis]
MRDSQLDWIWSRYNTSPDPASGMQSLYQTCLVFTKHVLQPSHIILRGGGFVLHPELAIPLTDIVTSMDRLLYLAAKHVQLRSAPCIGQQQLRILTTTEGLHACATYNQVVYGWVTLIDRLARAMRELQWLCIGEDPSRYSWSSWMPGILASLRPSLRSKLPIEFLQSHGIMVLPPAANISDTAASKSAGLHSCNPMQSSQVSLGSVKVGELAIPEETKGCPRPPRLEPGEDPARCVRESTTDRGAVHAPVSPNPSNAAAAYVSDGTSMSDLMYKFTNYPTPDISLFARTRCIVNLKSIGNSDITDYGIGCALGRFALEASFFRIVENTVEEMQSTLTKASSLAPGRNTCFLVDPCGVLMRMLRGTNTIDELRAAWTSLSERMFISQRHLADYQLAHHGEKGGNIPATELDRESAPRGVHSRLVPSSAVNLEVVCAPVPPLGGSFEALAPDARDESAAQLALNRTAVRTIRSKGLPANALAIAHVTPSSKSLAPACAKADAVELGGLQVERVACVKASTVELGGLRIEIAEPHTKAGAVERGWRAHGTTKDGGLKDHQQCLEKENRLTFPDCAFPPELHAARSSRNPAGMTSEGERDVAPHGAASPAPDSPSPKSHAPALAIASTVEHGGLHEGDMEWCARDDKTSERTHLRPSPGRAPPASALTIVSQFVAERGGLESTMNQLLVHISDVGGVRTLRTSSTTYDAVAIAAGATACEVQAPARLITGEVELGGLHALISNAATLHSELESRTCNEDGRPPAHPGYPTPVSPSDSLVPSLSASTSVLVSVETLTLVSVIVRTRKIFHLAWIARGRLAPYLAWEREGIGTAPWSN